MDPVKSKSVKDPFDAYVAPGIKLFYVDYLDPNESYPFMVDSFSDRDFDEQPINDWLAHRIWGFYSRGSMIN